MRRNRLLPLYLGGGRLPPARASRAGSAGRAGGGWAGRGGRAGSCTWWDRSSRPAQPWERPGARGERRMPCLAPLRRGVLPLGEEDGRAQHGMSISRLGLQSWEAARQGNGVRSDPPIGRVSRSTELGAEKQDWFVPRLAGWSNVQDRQPWPRQSWGSGHSRPPGAPRARWVACRGHPMPSARWAVFTFCSRSTLCCHPRLPLASSPAELRSSCRGGPARSPRLLGKSSVS